MTLGNSNHHCNGALPDRQARPAETRVQMYQVAAHCFCRFAWSFYFVHRKEATSTFKAAKLMWLVKLSGDFPRDQRREWLRKRWECAENQKIEIPSLPELWEIAGGSKRLVPPLECVKDETGRLVPYEEWMKAHPLTPEQIEQNRLEFLKKFLPEEYEKEIKKRQGQNDEDLPNMRS